MPQGTLVGIRGFRTAAGNGAAAGDLAAVEIFAGLLVIKLLDLFEPEIAPVV